MTETTRPLPADAAAILPEDAGRATLLARVWRPDADGAAGPALCVVRDARLLDVTRKGIATMADLLAADDPAGLVATLEGRDLGPLDAILANSDPARHDPDGPHLLAPFDLQAVKAAGVTFARSMIERVIEEKAAGDPGKADALRHTLADEIGADLSAIRPGSHEAEALKAALLARGAWSQYLEVGIGPDPEIFTKAQPMSAVGFGADIGVHPMSRWNNPEPEIVLAVSPAGRIVGATLGNDVNLRDVEGRSALLLSKAKDNNASAAIGPFLRLFDDGFGLDQVRAETVGLSVDGPDGFTLEGTSAMSEISRDPADLVAAAIGAHHGYPDGLCLYLGTMFAPTKDRGEAGSGFTHLMGDRVTIFAPHLGTLANRVAATDACPPWTFGAGALMRNLSARGLL